MKNDIPIPIPGEPVRGSQSGAPIMAIFDLLGRRWAMGIIWNLHRGPSTFRGLQEYCESISPSILNKRLKELRAAKIIYNSSEGYALTPMGKELFYRIKPLGDWALEWAKEITGETWQKTKRD